jgi:hypothetical protein
MLKERIFNMARLNKTQLYAIRWLNHEDCSNEKIANELGLNIDQVVKALEKNSSTSTDPQVAIKTQPVNNIINKTAGKGIGGVTIMTKEASEMSDGAYKNNNKTNPAINKSIFRPKKNG